jgi:hypothetical protein
MHTKIKRGGYLQGNIEQHSDLCITDISQMHIIFRPMGTQFLLMFRIVRKDAIERNHYC